jgi:hypothetical protein
VYDVQRLSDQSVSDQNSKLHKHNKNTWKYDHKRSPIFYDSISHFHPVQCEQR